MVRWAHDVLSACEASLGPQAAEQLKAWLASGNEREPVETWRYLTQCLLRPEHSLGVHQAMHGAVFSTAVWPAAALGPPPVWWPDWQAVQGHSVSKFLAQFKGDAEFEAARTGDPRKDWAHLHALSVRDPELFWSALLLRDLAVPFAVPPTRMLQQHPTNPDQSVWLPGAAFNVAWAALTTPRGGCHASKRAIVWADEGSPGHIGTMSVGQLREGALRVAAAVRQLVPQGAAVAVMLPMGPLAIALYLGCVLAGCMVVSIADSFAPHEVATRLRIAHTRLVFTQDVVVRGGKALPLYSRMVEAAAPRTVVLPASAALDPAALRPGTSTTFPGSGASSSPSTNPAVTLRDGDLWWASFLALPGSQGEAEVQAVAAAAAAAAGAGSAGAQAGAAGGQAAGSLLGLGTPAPAWLHLEADPSEPTNCLFSSGTTGEPKAIPWTHVTPLRCAADGWAHQGIVPGDVVAWPTSLGWMMGPWLVYASLFNGAAMALFNGVPTIAAFGEFMAAARVNILGLVPSIVKAWRHSGCLQGIPWADALRAISSTGEASAPEDYLWLVAQTGYRAPVIEYCGGTEMGGGYITSTALHPHAPSTFTTPAIGTQLVLLTAQKVQGSGAAGGPLALLPSPHGLGAEPAVGEVALCAPTLGCSQKLLNKDHYEVYYAGMPPDPQAPGRPLRRHGDELARLPGGRYVALGRVDDTMNLGGIKVSSVELERVVLEGVQGLSEAAAVGVPTPGGGPEQLVLFLVAKPGAGEASSSGSNKGSSSTAKALQQACQEAIRTRLNPLFRVSQVQLVEGLPRNASNKVMRRVLRDQLMQGKGADTGAGSGGTGAGAAPRAKL